MIDDEFSIDIGEAIAMVPDFEADDWQALVIQYNITDFDENACIKLSNVRRPLVLVRGKPITREQAMRLIVGEEPLFQEVPDNQSAGWDSRRSRGVLGGIFSRGRCDFPNTWVYTDGIDK